MFKRLNAWILSRPPKVERARSLVRHTYTYLKQEVRGRSALRPDASEHGLLMLALARRNFWKRVTDEEFRLKYLFRQTRVVLPRTADLPTNLREIVEKEVFVLWGRTTPERYQQFLAAARSELEGIMLADGLTSPPDPDA